MGAVHPGAPERRGDASREPGDDQQQRQRPGGAGARGEVLRPAGGELPPGQVGGESTAALLREARDDDKVKALVLRVNSPGGEVFASEQIRREVAALKDAGKPVVA